MSSSFSSLTPVYRRHTGFSLFELLIVISLIGVMASVAILAYGGVRAGAVDQRDKRNAQEIATISSAAAAAGATFVVPGDEEATIDNLAAGCTPTSGIFRGKTFQIPSLERYEIRGAMRFLVLTENDLAYRQGDTNVHSSEKDPSTQPEG